MGFELVGVILTTVYLGKLIDENYGTKGLGIAGLPMLGLAGWIAHIVILSKSVEKAEENQSSTNPKSE